MNGTREEEGEEDENSFIYLQSLDIHLFPLQSSNIWLQLVVSNCECENIFFISIENTKSGFQTLNKVKVNRIRNSKYVWEQRFTEITIDNRKKKTEAKSYFSHWSSGFLFPFWKLATISHTQTEKSCRNSIYRNSSA